MQKKQNTTGLIWFRNNLRVNDNVSLKKAIENHKRVIAVFYFNPKHFKKEIFGFKKTEKFRAQFLIETVKNLQKNLQDLSFSMVLLLAITDNLELNVILNLIILLKVSLFLS